MTPKDEWDDGPAPDPVAIKARQYLSLQAQIDALETQAKLLSYEIAREFPAGPGVHDKTFGDTVITLSRSERWSWDKAVIKSILTLSKPGPLTDEIKSVLDESIVIHKLGFAKLSPEAQKILRAALTVKDGPFKIAVAVKDSST
jgi:hypothetical protein